MKTHHGDKFWAFVGKISSIVLLLGAIVGIYMQLIPNGPKLKANCTITEFRYTPFMIDLDYLQ